MSTREDLERRIAASKANIEAQQQENELAKLEQYASDMEAYAKLCSEHGESQLSILEPKHFVLGAPTFVVVKSPEQDQYNRYAQTVRKAKDKDSQMRAQEQLGRSCLVYPEVGELRDAMLKAFPGTILSVAVVAAKQGELEEQAEGKG
jgi:hypothetical protein